jgi:hypothetical protein
MSQTASDLVNAELAHARCLALELEYLADRGTAFPTNLMQLLDQYKSARDALRAYDMEILAALRREQK